MLPVCGRRGCWAAALGQRMAGAAGAAAAVAARPRTRTAAGGLAGGLAGGRSARVLLVAAGRPFSSSPAAAASSTRWKARQGRDPFAREAKVQGLKSRAAFKLLEIDAKHRLFKPGQTVVDLGYAPGSWSQVAIERTKPSGRVLGIDLIPAQPPRGVSTIQGNFLSPAVQQLVKEFLARPAPAAKTETKTRTKTTAADTATATAASGNVVEDRPSYIDLERQATAQTAAADAVDGYLVDVVLSDMSAPWPQTYGFWLQTLSFPYRRMMNTSGNAFRDHAGSMDLCRAALSFASDTLRPGGHFVCKFYQGGEDKALESRLKKMFAKVVREKPESSRSESKESFFVALRRKKDVAWHDLEGMDGQP